MLLTLSLIATIGSQQPIATPLHYSCATADKNFYLLRLIEDDSAVQRIVFQDPKFEDITNRQQSLVKKAFTETNFEKIDLLEEFCYSDAKNAEISAEFQDLFDKYPSVRTFVASKLRPSGAYQLFSGLSDRDLIAKAWLECAKGINRIIRSYGLQTIDTPSPQIDAPLYEAKTMKQYGGFIKSMFGYLTENSKSTDSFFTLSRELSFQLLRFHNRDEAGRLEPLEKLGNRLSYQNAAKTAWGNYPYSVILVPGLGPENTIQRVSPLPRMLLKLVAEKWRAKAAPFIAVTGGYCYPNRTPYAESLEMKRTLMDEYGVPEKAILIDPHARHTTTNIRNVIRLMFRYRFPMDKPGLIFTNTYQADDIVAKSFEVRCQKVFGYQPATYKRIKPFEVEFMPSLNSLTLDPSDPLDP